MTTKPWYARKRVLLPLLTLITFTLATATAIYRSQTSFIVIYNQTGEPIPALRASACNQSRTFSNLPDEGSIRWKLDRSGSPTTVQLEFPTDPPTTWEDLLIHPTGGYRITIHVWPNHHIETDTQVSPWQSLFNPAP